MFIPLRVHSVFSKGKGGVTLGEAAAWAGRMKLPAAALTDIDNLHGWAKWKRAAEAKGVVPLFGCETELGGRRFLLLVKERQGYERLVMALNRKELAETEGLVVILIPGPADEPFLLQADSLRQSEDFYLGCDFFNFKTAQGLARTHGLRTVWTNPLKFVVNPERVILLRAIQDKVPFPPERDRLLKKMDLFGPDQEALALGKLGQPARDALDRTLEVAGKCRFDFQGIVPPLPADLFPTPLREVVMDRLRAARDLSWNERQRALRELEAIEGSGFGPYFLIVYDVVEFARKRGILHNLKGSGASSFVAYLLGLSHINPVEFDLYFERFLNRGRDDPPDIDLDFDSRRRDEVLAYVLEKYSRGRTGAAFVCSLKNYRGRSALYETARAFGVPPQEARSLSKKVPFFAEPDILKKDRPPAGFREVWRLAADLTDVYCEKSLHVGGVILTPAPADRYLPLEKSAKGLLMSHFDRDAVEDLKLIKLDLLSVRGLAAVSQTKDSLNLRTIPAGDARTYGLLAAASTIGCFQVESPAMMNLLRRMGPADIQELTQALALIRPGPTESGMKETLLRGREGRDTARDPFLLKILPETGGLLLYEEQVMQVAERVAGMPAEEGDLLRRGLKRRGGDAALKDKFFREARGRGYASAEVERLWRTMEKFSSYSFNKAHSASYAAMAYQAAYLKAHHPVPYLAAVLNAGGGYYEFTEYIEEAKRLGIRILGPDANRSGYEFEVEEGAIRVGLSSIKRLALKTADKVIEERQNGGYLSIEDFLARVRLTRTELLALIRAGVFDSLEASRTRQILRYFQGIEGWDILERAAELDPKDKARMLLESLGFLPEGDPLSLFEGDRPGLRIKDLARCRDEEVELLVRVVDARQKMTGGGRKYFYLFEDETGQLEGVGQAKCPAFGAPPLCFVRAEVRPDGHGRPKAFNCSFYSPSP